MCTMVRSNRKWLLPLQHLNCLRKHQRHVCFSSMLNLTTGATVKITTQAIVDSSEAHFGSVVDVIKVHLITIKLQSIWYSSYHWDYIISLTESLLNKRAKSFTWFKDLTFFRKIIFLIHLQKPAFNPWRALNLRFLLRRSTRETMIYFS